MDNFLSKIILRVALNIVFIGVLLLFYTFFTILVASCFPVLFIYILVFILAPIMMFAIILYINNFINQFSRLDMTKISIFISIMIGLLIHIFYWDFQASRPVGTGLENMFGNMFEGINLLGTICMAIVTLIVVGKYIYDNRSYKD